MKAVGIEIYEVPCVANGTPGPWKTAKDLRRMLLHPPQSFYDLGLHSSVTPQFEVHKWQHSNNTHCEIQLFHTLCGDRYILLYMFVFSFAKSCRILQAWLGFMPSQQLAALQAIRTTCHERGQRWFLTFPTSFTHKAVFCLFMSFYDLWFLCLCIVEERNTLNTCRANDAGCWRRLSV